MTHFTLQAKGKRADHGESRQAEEPRRSKETRKNSEISAFLTPNATWISFNFLFFLLLQTHCVHTQSLYYFPCCFLGTNYHNNQWSDNGRRSVQVKIVKESRIFFSFYLFFLFDMDPWMAIVNMLYKSTAYTEASFITH